MKVLLVNPACLDKRITDDDATVVPIGLYYLAAQLLDKGIPAGILNLAGIRQRNGDRTASEQTETRSTASPDAKAAKAAKAAEAVEASDDDAAAARTFAAALDREKPDIIGFSVTNPSRFSAMACARLAKTILPGVRVVFGGPAPTFMADHLFAACPGLDVAVRGEGERSFVDLVTVLDAREKDPAPDLSSVKGLVFRQGSGLTDTGLPDPVDDLDSLARPSKYFTFQHLAMSRGCPGKCTFCGSPRFWGSSRVRRHSVDWFFEEIKTLVPKGVSHFFISDDTFTQDREAVLLLCQKIIKGSLSITWNAISRVDYVDAELLSAMRRAGCIQISYGVESGAASIRKTLGKPVNEKACIRAFDLTRSFGIMPRAYFIYGSPGETPATIDQSISLMKRLAPLSAVFYMLVVFPGTHLYTRVRDKGLISDDIWSNAIEDLPWFELDPDLDFQQVKEFGHRLRQAFFTNLKEGILSLELEEDTTLYPFHADFLSRLAMTFSQGEYAQDPRIDAPQDIARRLFERALTYARDPRAYLGLAMIRQKQKDMAGALDLLKKGLASFPGHRDLSIGMGVCLMNMGDFASALNCFTPFDIEPGLRHYIDICNARITR